MVEQWEGNIDVSAIVRPHIPLGKESKARLCNGENASTYLSHGNSS